MSSGSFENVTELFAYKCLIHMYKQDLALNNLQGLIYLKAQQTN